MKNIKTISAVIAVLVMMTVSATAQFKSQIENQPSASEYLVRPAPSLSNLMSWFNPDNFHMRQSAGISYSSFGGQGVSLASYTNSMFYRIADPLDVRMDVTLQGSPFGQNNMYQKNSLNGIFLSRAELNYRPWENFLINVRYSQLPTRSYWMTPYGSSMFGDE